jgi:hypothetical protein
MPGLTRRRMTVRACGLVFVVSLLSAAVPEAPACPIPPALSWYITNAEAIVVTRVIGVSIDAPGSEAIDEATSESVPGEAADVATPNDDGDVRVNGLLRDALPARRLMHAVPVRVLKEGDRVPDVVELEAFLDADEPVDDAILIGKLHLVFLQGDADDERALSVLDSRELATHDLERSYAALISDWLAIKALGGDEETVEQRIDWAIGSLDQPAVRGDALRELYEQAGSWEEAEVLELLNGAQRARLFERLDSCGASDLYVGLGLASLLAPLRDERVAAFARRAIRDVPDDELYLAISAMQQYSDFYGWRTGSALAAMAQDNMSPEEIRAIVSRFEALADERQEDDALLREIDAVAPVDEEVDDVDNGTGDATT